MLRKDLIGIAAQKRYPDDPIKQECFEMGAFWADCNKESISDMQEEARALHELYSSYVNALRCIKDIRALELDLQKPPTPKS